MALSAPLNENTDTYAGNLSETPCSPPLNTTHITPRAFAKKICLGTLGLKSSTTIVMHNPSVKHKVSVQSLNRPRSTPSSDASSGLSSTYSSKLSAAENDSTRKTSVDSRFSIVTKDTIRRRNNGRNPRTRSSPEGCGLDTIVESGTDQIQPTILTVENAAAAKIYFETHFNSMLNRGAARDGRRRYMESQLFFSPHLDETQKHAIRTSFFHEETWHLRESRVLKWQSQSATRGSGDSPYIQRYESLKVLGKGSFGVVRLVRERMISDYAPSAQVFAMKVIRKSDMLRSSQEGHLRAERDFLVASKGSDWYVCLCKSCT